MIQVQSKKCNGNIQKSSRYIAPGMLAKERGYGIRRTSGTSSGNAASYLDKVDSEKRLAEGQETTYVRSHRIMGGISTHDLVMHFGNDQYKERDFNEDCCFLDLLKICKKFIDIHTVGVIIEDDIGLPVRNDKDMLILFKKYANEKYIHLHVEMDESVEPMNLPLPRGKPTLESDPIVVDVLILSDVRANEKVSVRADVINGIVNATTFQFFTTVSKKFNVETDLLAISECTINKEFQIPSEAAGHFLVVKVTPMSEEGEYGEPRYTVSEKRIEDSVPPKLKKHRGRNKNKTIASLQRGQNLEINFYNNRAVGDNHKCWSWHLGKIVRDKNMCPIQMKSWKALADTNKDHMWASVKECFSNSNLEAYRDHTLEHMRDLWTAWMSTLNKKYVKPCKTRVAALKNVPQGMDTKDWEWLVTNKFLTDKFQKNSEQNTKNRGFGFMPHRSGSKPHRQFIYDMGGKDNNPPDLAQIFMSTRQKKGKFVQPEEQDKYVSLHHF